tara:strand:- start:1542 stop:1706 length:165 start_codon:yes stop_codon:yes gene_type:complete
MIKKIFSIEQLNVKKLLLVLAIFWFVFVNTYFYFDLLISRWNQIISLMERIFGL